MANRRMLSKSISISRKVNQLSEFAQLLFTWMIAHTDDFGRIDGDPEIVKAIVMPLSKKKTQDFIHALIEMVCANLILWYRAENDLLIQIINFDEHQPNLSKRTSSKHPEFKNEYKQALDFLGNAKLFSEFLGISEKVRPNLTEFNLTEQNRTKPNCSPKGDSPKGASPKGELEVRFDFFWKAYPKKKSKGQAQAVWMKLAPSEQLLATMIATIEQAKTSEQWQKDNGQFIPYPATWLNAKGWEDEENDPGEKESWSERRKKSLDDSLCKSMNSNMP